MGRALTSNVGLISAKLIVIFILFSFIFATITIAVPTEIPGIESQLPAPETRAWADDEFVISYDEAGFYNATRPDIAVAPPGSPFEGSVHSVWAELNNSVDDPYVEIHYSMSEASEGGFQWSNDDAAEEDRIISQDYTTEAKGPANPGDATTPSITIDPQGWIHVVWVEQYPDWTYEVHYSRSEDNGKTWTGFDGTGDTVITERTGEDSWWINQPRIAVTSVPLVIHVVWDEVPFSGDTQESWYARSVDQGGTWSLPVQISDPSGAGEPGAFEPDIATSGPLGEIVHVVWTQDSLLTGTSEVFYQRSMNAGQDWGLERTISFEVSDGSFAYRARLATADDDIHVIWDQTSAGPSEIFYSGSFDGGDSWTGEGLDTQISFADGSDAMWPTVAAWGGPIPEVHVAWVELDELSPLSTQEIHYSMTNDPLDPLSWTGLDADIILSHPDTEGFAEVHNPAIAVGEVGGKVRPQIVWDEINSAGALGKAELNTEIHYLPDTTYEVPINLGWNLISCPLIQNDTSILNVLDDSAGDGLTTWDKIMYYENTGSSVSWKSYATYKPSSLNDLNNITHKMGIWINITSLGDGNLTVNGDYGTSTIIDLKAGWNLVGYPAQASKSITDAFGGINDRPVEGYLANATYLITQLPGTYLMLPGEGYWVHVASDTTWTVDW